MTLKIVLTVDQDHGEQLIGLLAKAFGRGELGIGDIRIERDPGGTVEEKFLKGVAPLRVVRKSTVAKLIAAGTKKPKFKRSGYSLGMRAHKSGKPNGVVVTLLGLAQNATREGLLEAWMKHSLNRNGISATLSKLRHRGYVVQVDYGVWRLTPLGTEFVKHWREAHGPEVE